MGAHAPRVPPRKQLSKAVDGPCVLATLKHVMAAHSSTHRHAALLQPLERGPEEYKPSYPEPPPTSSDEGKEG